MRQDGGMDDPWEDRAAAARAEWIEDREDSPGRMKPMDLREDMTLAIHPEGDEPYVVRVASVEENEDGSFTVTTKPFGDLPEPYYLTRGLDCDTLRLLALPYADHPDYREEWRP